MKYTVVSFDCQRFLPPASVVEAIEAEPSFCVSVCLYVSTLTAELFDLLLGKRSVQFGKRGRYVNAQAFSFGIKG